VRHLVLLVALPALAGIAPAGEPVRQMRERHLAPIAFLPAAGAANYIVEEGGLGRLCTIKGAGYFTAPLQLEDGAVIEDVTVFLEDDGRDSLGMMSLVRRGLEKFDILAFTPVSVGTGEVETLSTTAISAPVIDNHDATYLLHVVLSGPGVCLYGARVRYRGPAH
jgi:hypothetical protein